MATKYLLFALALTGYSITHAEMFFDSRSRLFFTFPVAKNINPSEYNQYATDLFEDFVRYGSDGKSTIEYAWRISFAKAMQKATNASTPTSRQFIEDIKDLRKPQDTWPIVAGNFWPSSL